MVESIIVEASGGQAVLDGGTTCVFKNTVSPARPSLRVGIDDVELLEQDSFDEC